MLQREESQSASLPQDDTLEMEHPEHPHVGLTKIYDTLYRLGLTANYTGFFYTSYAVWLTAEHPDRLLLVTKWLYPSVAKQYHTSAAAVERGIRSATSTAWRTSPQLLQKMAGFPLTKKPSAAKFIAILCKYFSSHRAA